MPYLPNEIDATEDIVAYIKCIYTRRQPVEINVVRCGVVWNRLIDHSQTTRQHYLNYVLQSMAYYFSVSIFAVSICMPECVCANL